MTLKIWRGDAPAVAQVTRITPASVEIGDVFTLTMNGKSISVTATAATVANVCTLLAAAIAAARTTIPEFTEFTVTNQTTSLLLTASTAGVPFVITASATNGSATSVSVTTTTNGAAAGTGTNMTQTFRIPLTASGTFTINIGGQVTSALNEDASAATVESAVEGLSTIGSGNVDVARTSDSNDYIYTMTFLGALAETTVATAIVTLTSFVPLIRTTQQGSFTGTIQNEIQTVDTGSITGGTTFDLTIEGDTFSIACNASAATVEAVIGASLSVDVTKSGQVFFIEFVGGLGSTNVGQATASVYSASAASTHNIAVSTTPASSGSGAANEVQVVTLTGSPTGGTFTLTFDGQTTGTIAYNADAATVDAALEALSNIGAGDITVTGSAGGPWTVTFGNAMAATNQPQMTANGASLTGGSGQTIAVDAVTASAGPNHWDTAGNWLPSGVPANGDDVRFEVGNVQCLYGLDQSAVTLATFHVAQSYTGRIGLNRVNSLGYFEYRTTELTIGATSILIGYGTGSGPSKVALNCGSVQASLEVRESGGSSESGIPAVTWRGTHASNALQIYGGDVGIAPYSDQSANVDTLIQRGGTLAAKHTAFLTSILFTSATFYNCTLDGQPLESY